MKRNNWLFILILLLGLGLVLGACGGDDDDDSSSSGDDDTSVEDDDDTGGQDDDTDVDDDDTTPDDDDDDTTDDDDDDTEPEDTEYGPVICAIPDPEGLGDDITVGGAVVGGVIATYVYDDATCNPIAGADVNGVVTDANGYAEVNATKGETLVAAVADGYFGWAIKADAGVMYFRLQPVETSGSFTDSSDGEFLADGQSLGLTNPSGTYTIANLLSLLDSTIFIGGAVPGLNRNTLLSTDFTNGLLPTTSWPLTYEYEMKDKAANAGSKDGDTIDMPRNVYFPSLDVDINLIGLVTASASGVNEAYQIPVNTTWSEVPIEGLVASIVAGEAVSVDLIINLITNPDDLIEALMAALPKIINDALMIDHVAGDPAWSGTGAPDMEVVDPIAAKNNVAVTISGAVAGYDYLGIMASEVPNRLLVPQSIKLFDSGAATFPVAAMPDSDYVLAVAKTNVLEVLAGSGDPVELNMAMKYAENLSEFTGGITLADGADFLPVFADTTAYNDTTGVLTWALSDKASVDAYVVIVDPNQDDVFEMGIAVLPGTENTFDITTFGAVTPSVDDVLVLIGLDLPEGVSLNEFNLPGIIGYNSSAINIWTNYPIDELLNPEL